MQLKLFLVFFSIATKSTLSKQYKFCQCCIIPLWQDPTGGGTEKDGSKSEKYCSYCYRNGAYKQPDITADEIRTFVVEKLEEKQWPRFLAKVIYKLERWKDK